MVRGIGKGNPEETNKLDSPNRESLPHPADSTSKKTHWFIQALFRLFACFRKTPNNQGTPPPSATITPIEKVTSVTEPLLPKGPDSLQCNIFLTFDPTSKEGDLELTLTNPNKKLEPLSRISRRCPHTEAPIKSRINLKREGKITVTLSNNGTEKELNSFVIDNLTDIKSLGVHVSANDVVSLTINKPSPSN